VVTPLQQPQSSSTKLQQYAVTHTQQ